MVANEARIENGTLKGEMVINVMNDKRPHYCDFAEQYDLSLDRSVTIGDSRDDFRPTDRGLNIRFNANEQAVDVVDVMIEGSDLREIIPAVTEWDDLSTERTS